MPGSRRLAFAHANDRALEHVAGQEIGKLLGPIGVGGRVEHVHKMHWTLERARPSRIEIAVNDGGRHGRAVLARTDRKRFEVERIVHAELAGKAGVLRQRSEEHTSELQSLMRNSYAVFCLKKKKQ